MSQAEIITIGIGMILSAMLVVWVGFMSFNLGRMDSTLDHIIAGSSCAVRPQ